MKIKNNVMIACILLFSYGCGSSGGNTPYTEIQSEENSTEALDSNSNDDTFDFVNSIDNISEEPTNIVAADTTFIEDGQTYYQTEYNVYNNEGLMGIVQVSDDYCLSAIDESYSSSIYGPQNAEEMFIQLSEFNSTYNTPYRRYSNIRYVYEAPDCD